MRAKGCVGIRPQTARLNAPQNMAGVPALSVPCGRDKELPVGLQIIGPSGRDDTVFRLAANYQRA